MERLNTEIKKCMDRVDSDVTLRHFNTIQFTIEEWELYANQYLYAYTKTYNK